MRRPAPLYPHDRRDPEIWTALELDSSLPISPEMKRAWLKDCSRPSRQYLLPLLRPFLYLAIMLIQVFRVFFPRALSSSRLLHFVIRNGLKTFVTPEGNFLFLRHFHLGSQILEFLAANIDGVALKTEPLCPRTLDDVRDHLIIQHDCNLFNFIIDLNTQLKERGLELRARKPLDFRALKPPPLRVEDFPRRWTNRLDIQTATDLFVPIFQFLLSDREFWRAVHSLQLDETIGLYFAKLLGLGDRLFLVNNRHPLIPNLTLGAAQRLSLHSYSTEVLHGLLLEMKAKAEKTCTPHSFNVEMDPSRPPARPHPDASPL